MKPVHEIIAKGMALGHLHGRYRGILNAKKAGATVFAFRRTSETYDRAVDWLRKRMEVSKKDLDALEELYSAQALNISKNLEEWVDSKMETAAMNVVAEGMTTREGTRAMIEAMQSVGILPAEITTPKQAYLGETVFRTQTKLAYGAARWQEDQEDWVQEILWGYKYVTIGDDRVRPTHAALEGATAPKDDPIWNTIWPPNGWACRCDILDLFDEREIVKPDPATIAAGPDKGFGYNPGKLFLKAA
jgi:SPP1 gp7 family putative phage head morphogenesis protein